MIAEFEKRYPSIKVKFNRAGSENLLTRILTEARAKRVAVDGTETPARVWPTRRPDRPCIRADGGDKTDQDGAG
jgi:hypothetical protein